MDKAKALQTLSMPLFFLVVEVPSQMFAWKCHEKSWVEVANREGLRAIVFLMGLHKYIRRMAVSFSG